MLKKLNVVPSMNLKAAADFEKAASKNLRGANMKADGRFRPRESTLRSNVKSPGKIGGKAWSGKQKERFLSKLDLFFFHLAELEQNAHGWNEARRMRRFAYNNAAFDISRGLL